MGTDWDSARNTDPYYISAAEEQKIIDEELEMTTATPKPRAGEHNAMCIWDDCDQDAIYCEGHAREYMLPDINALLGALEELVTRCDGEEGVRADGSNIQTMRASAVLAKHGR